MSDSDKCILTALMVLCFLALMAWITLSLDLHVCKLVSVP